MLDKFTNTFTTNSVTLDFADLATSTYQVGGSEADWGDTVTYSFDFVIAFEAHGNIVI